MVVVREQMSFLESSSTGLNTFIIVYTHGKGMFTVL